MERTCGECYVCCHIFQIKEDNFFKPGYETCPHIDLSLCNGKCSIYSRRPITCKDFLCLWKYETGSESDRPDKSGVMLYLGQFNNGTWIFALEKWKDAISTTGIQMITTTASMYDLPLIISKHDSRPPDDTGDWTLIKESIKHRCTSMMGELITYLDNEKIYGVYKLRK